jgi:serine/threonine-protein kinase
METGGSPVETRMAGAAEELKKGDTLEGYKILWPLGAGAASLVYAVQDPKTKEVWALKHVLRDEAHKDLRFLQQAEHEYQVASNLNHPGVRKIVRLIKQKAGLLTLKGIILVMEHVDGISVDKYAPVGRPPLRDDLDLALDIFIQTAEGLKHMHSRSWVHADMKPNNIMICDGKIAKIIDLGQSCKIGTVKPRIQGTPDYIAPEQVHRRPITPKTDIYNFGATMYWVFTGEYIPTALAKGDSLVDKLDDVLMQRPKPAIELNPRIPPKLNEIIMHCVEIDPEMRPESMQPVIERLQIVLGLLRARRASGLSGKSGSPINGGGGSGGSKAGVNPNQQSSAGMRANQKSGSGVPVNDESGGPIAAKPMK